MPFHQGFPAARVFARCWAARRAIEKRTRADLSLPRLAGPLDRRAGGAAAQSSDPDRAHAAQHLSDQESRRKPLALSQANRASDHDFWRAEEILFTKRAAAGRADGHAAFAAAPRVRRAG